MVKCAECGTEFDVEDARDEFRSTWHGDPEYDEMYDGETCGSCAISETQANYNTGVAIMMMNGDEDYDQEHVDSYL